MVNPLVTFSRTYLIEILQYILAVNLDTSRNVKKQDAGRNINKPNSSSKHADNYLFQNLRPLSFKCTWKMMLKKVKYSSTHLKSQGQLLNNLFNFVVSHITSPI